MCRITFKSGQFSRLTILADVIIKDRTRCLQFVNSMLSHWAWKWPCDIVYRFCRPILSDNWTIPTESGQVYRSWDICFGATVCVFRVWGRLPAVAHVWSVGSSMIICLVWRAVTAAAGSAGRCTSKSRSLQAFLLVCPSVCLSVCLSCSRLITATEVLAVLPDFEFLEPLLVSK